MTKTQTKTATTNTIAKSKGRPVNMNSARQQRLALQAELKQNGVTVKRGRPVAADSARQQRLAVKGTVTLGRPVNVDSARQQKLQRIAEAKAAGTYKLGRPAKQKIEA